MKKNFFTATVLLLIFSCNKTSLTKNSLNASSNDMATTSGGGLVAWYTFNGDALDHSSFGNNPTFNSATSTAGAKGIPNTAYYFDGSTSYMMIPNSSSLNPKKEITIAAFVEPQGFYQGPCHGNRIINKGGDDAANGRYGLGFDDGLYYKYNQCSRNLNENQETFYGYYGNGFAAATATDSTDRVRTNRWYELVLTVDSNKVTRLYVNGVLKTTSLNTSSTFTTNKSAPLYIGRMGAELYPYFFNGIIDEIRIYNKAVDLAGAQKISKEMSDQ